AGGTAAAREGRRGPDPGRGARPSRADGARARGRVPEPALPGHARERPRVGPGRRGWRERSLHLDARSEARERRGPEDDERGDRVDGAPARAPRLARARSRTGGSRAMSPRIRARPDVRLEESGTRLAEP